MDSDSSHTLHALALESAGIATWSWVVGNPWVSCSENVALILGLPIGSVNGSLQELQNSLFPADLPAVQRAVAEAVQGKREECLLEFRARWPNGQHHWLEAHGFVQRNPDDESATLFGTLVNIDQRKQLLETFEELTRHTLRCAGHDFFRELVRGLALSLNADYALVGELKPGEKSPESIQILALWTRDGFAENFTYRLIDTPCAHVVSGAPCVYPSDVVTQFPKDQLLRDMEVEAYAGVPLFSSQNSPQGLLVAMFKRPCMPTESEFIRSTLLLFSTRASAELELIYAQQKLSESEERLGVIVDNTPNVAVQIYDSNGCVRSWNRASEGMFGFSAAEALGRTLDCTILTPEEAAHFLTVLRRIEQTGESVGPAEYVFHRRDGSEGCCLSTTFALPSTGASRTFCCMDIDITEQRRLREELVQAQKLESISRLAGGIAHDFNNLLCAVAGHAELLDHRIAPSAPERRHTQSIAQACRRGAALTEQLLGYARRQVVKPVLLNLNGQLEKAMALLKPLLPENIEVVLNLSVDLWQVRFDQNQLDQIVVNLCLNARDAMPQGGTLTISTSNRDIAGDGAGRKDAPLSGKFVELSVNDTGFGIAPETLPKIFDPFFTTKEPGKGTGLGLATCYGIVKQHAGHIEVESRQGVGTIMRVLLPKAEGSVVIEEPSRTSTPSSAVRNSTILVVEDDPLIAELIVPILKEAGARVLRAASVAEAREVADKFVGPISLLITDVVIPGGSGKQIATELELSGKVRCTLYISGYAEDSIAHEGVIEEGIHFLPKPFALSKLIQKVNELLGSDQTHAA